MGLPPFPLWCGSDESANGNMDKYATFAGNVLLFKGNLRTVTKLL